MKNTLGVGIPGVLDTIQYINNLNSELYQHKDLFSRVMVNPDAPGRPDFNGMKAYLEAVRDRLAEINHWYIDGSDEIPVRHLVEKTLQLTDFDFMTFPSDQSWYMNQQGVYDCRKLFDQDVIAAVLDLAADLVLRTDHPVNALYEMIRTCAVTMLNQMKVYLANFIRALNGATDDPIYRLCNDQVVFSDEEIEAKNAEIAENHRREVEAERRKAEINAATKHVQLIVDILDKDSADASIDPKIHEIIVKLSNNYPSVAQVIKDPDRFDSILGLYGAALFDEEDEERIRLGIKTLLSSLTGEYPSIVLSVNSDKYCQLRYVRALVKQFKALGIVTVAHDMNSHEPIEDLPDDYTGQIHIY